MLLIPYKPDPPPAIDGALSEWAKVPNAQVINRPEQVTYGRDMWKSPADLSAKVWLAWREEALYLAADVTDDVVRQKQGGRELWRGDNVQLLLDVTPDDEPERNSIGEGQFQLGFSPGNFRHTGDRLVDLGPEVFVFKPIGVSPQGMRMAAQRTERGYTIEAAVPWTLLEVKPATGLRLSLEVCISDTDGIEAAQEKMMTLSSALWEHSRKRLLPAMLAPADGSAPPVTQGVDIKQSLRLHLGESQELHFDAPSTPAGKEAVLTLKARIEYPSVGGYNYPVRLVLNGTPLDLTRLLNKEAQEERVDGVVQVMVIESDHLGVGYAPDFESPDVHPNYALKRAKVCQIDLRVTDLVKRSGNVLIVQNVLGRELTYDLVVADCRLEFRPPRRPKVKRGPPTGPLPVIEPDKIHKVAYTVAQEKSGDLILRSGGEVFNVKSEFSTPEGRWHTGSNDYFTWKRQIEKRDEAVIIRDTFVNLTDENLPLMQRHTVRRAKVGSSGRKVWLGGLSVSGPRGTSSEPANPTSFLTVGKVGIGLMPLDDVSLVHVTNFSVDDCVGLADNQFVLKPKVTHTAEWAILPVPRPDYFAFLNAARRLRDVNFTIDGSFSFLCPYPGYPADKWTDDQLRQFHRCRNAKYITGTIMYPRYKEYYPHGTVFQELDLDYVIKQTARVRAAVPEAKQLYYFHCFLEVREDAPAKYPDARVLCSDGTQGNYGDSMEKIFFPTETNSFGRDIEKNVDLILDRMGCDGVYWDEFEYSRYQYHYGEPWDGVSADIDPTTMKITRLKSSVALISQPFRVALARRILSRGPFVGNGAPHTRTMAALHFPRFVETGSISNCVQTHLYTPLALGDHLTERTEADAYHVMLGALDYGCLYYWYSDTTVVATYPTLTSCMFPMTPLELHEGFTIGKERIVTNRSGIFGWGDKSRHEVHVFNGEGKEVPGFRAPGVIRGGKTYTEVRIGEGWSAAIVRRQ